MQKLDRRFLKVSVVVKGIVAEAPAEPTLGDQYISSSASWGGENYLMYYNGSSWEATSPSTDMLEVFNSATGEYLRFNGTNWVSVASIASYVTPGLVREDFTLTAADITGKAVTLTGTPKAGTEARVMLFALGMLQLASDYEATIASSAGDSSTVSWDVNGSSLDGLLRAGDIVTVLYVPE